MSSKSKYGFYNGPDLEAGGTSIKGKEVKALRENILEEGLLKEGDVILDYGAGKYARNANFLRSKGFKVYAYDPFNNNGKDPWEDEGVSNIIPDIKFDVVFSSFVLNVVKNETMLNILEYIDSLNPRFTFHITRNKDIFDSIKKSIKTNKELFKFIDKYYPDKSLKEDITDDKLMDLSLFGYSTSRGFQIIPMLENYGYSNVKDTNGYKVYIK